jgi:hypothetical protein
MLCKVCCSCGIQRVHQSVVGVNRIGTLYAKVEGVIDRRIGIWMRKLASITARAISRRLYGGNTLAGSIGRHLDSCLNMATELERPAA